MQRGVPPNRPESREAALSSPSRGPTVPITGTPEQGLSAPPVVARATSPAPEGPHSCLVLCERSLAPGRPILVRQRELRLATLLVRYATPGTNRSQPSLATYVSNQEMTSSSLISSPRSTVRLYDSCCWQARGFSPRRLVLASCLPEAAWYRATCFE